MSQVSDPSANATFFCCSASKFKDVKIPDRDWEQPLRFVGHCERMILHAGRSIGVQAADREPLWKAVLSSRCPGCECNQCQHAMVPLYLRQFFTTGDMLAGLGHFLSGEMLLRAVPSRAFTHWHLRTGTKKLALSLTWSACYTVCCPLHSLKGHAPEDMLQKTISISMS